MKIKNLLFVAALAFCGSANAASYYVVPGNTSTGNDGSSWDKAITIWDIYENEAVAKKIEANSKYKNGDIFYFAGGTYYPTLEPGGGANRIYRGYIFVGGCDPTKGAYSEIPSYPSATPTIFSGDLNGDGVASPGDAKNLVYMRLGSKFTTDEDRYTIADEALKPLTFHGFDFGYTYNETEFPGSESADNLAQWGCVEACQGWVELNNCAIHDTYADKGSGFFVYGSLFNARDCQFYNNMARQTGAALRININTSSRYSKGTVDRCAFYNNTLTDTYGGAIALTAGELYIINSTVSGNYAYAEGAGVVSNGDNDGTRKLHIINSTISGNYCTADPEELYKTDSETGAIKNPGSWTGSELRLSANPNCEIWNSIIVGREDDGTVARAPFVFKDAPKDGSVFSLTLGYSIIGTMLPLLDYEWTWTDTYSYQNEANTWGVVFGDAELQDNGGNTMTVIPSADYFTKLSDENIYWPPYVGDAITMQMTLAEQPLFATTGYATPDLTVDQTGVKRNEDSEADYAPGAFDFYVERETVGLRGDANNDGTVNVNDITTIAEYILNGIVQGKWNAANADANHDGQINVNDITTTASIILGH